MSADITMASDDNPKTICSILLVIRRYLQLALDKFCLSTGRIMFPLCPEQSWKHFFVLKCTSFLKYKRCYRNYIYLHGNYIKIWVSSMLCLSTVFVIGFSKIAPIVMSTKCNFGSWLIVYQFQTWYFLSQAWCPNL